MDRKISAPTKFCIQGSLRAGLGIGTLNTGFWNVIIFEKQQLLSCYIMQMF